MDYLLKLSNLGPFLNIILLLIKFYTFPLVITTSIIFTPTILIIKCKFNNTS